MTNNVNFFLTLEIAYIYLLNYSTPLKMSNNNMKAVGGDDMYYGHQHKF